jgi:hypothetical protein
MRIASASIVFFLVGCASSEPEVTSPSHPASDTGSDVTVDSTMPETSVDASMETSVDAMTETDAGPEAHPLKVESMVPGGAFHDGVLRLRSGALVAGLEAGGVGYSPDAGKTWRMANVGLESAASLSIAGMIEHPYKDGFVLIAAGDQVLLTEDIGDLRHHPWKVSWKGAGAHTFDAGGAHPRRSGNLFAFTSVQSFVSTGHGLWRVPIDALSGIATWLRIDEGIIPDGEAHDLAVDSSGHLYIAMKGDGVWMSAAPGADPTIIVPMRGAGRCIHPVSMLPLVDRMYVACAHEGVRRFDVGAAGFMIDEPWTDLTSTPLAGGDAATGPYWKTLAGKVVAGKHVVFAGSEVSGSIVRSDDARGSAVTWTSLATSVDSAMVFPRTTGETWWFWDPSLRYGDAADATSARLSVVSQFAYDSTADRLFFSGNGGIAAVSHASSAPEIRPIGRTSGTRTLGLAIDPNHDDRIGALEATYGFVQLDGDVASEQKAETGLRAIAEDPSESIVYVGGDGKKVLKKTFARDVAWTEVATLDDPIVGLAAGKNDGETVILAATTRAILRKVSDGAFVDVTPVGFDPSADSVQIVWASKSKVVYLHDRKNGILRSNDGGAHWSKLVDAKSEAGEDPTDFIAVDPTKPERLYVVTTTEKGERALHRVVDDSGNDAAATGTAPKLLRVDGSPAKVGPIAVDAAGTLYAIETGAFARLWTYRDGTGFVDRSNSLDDPFAMFAGAATRVRDLRVISPKKAGDPTVIYFVGMGAGIVRVTVA